MHPKVILDEKLFLEKTSYNSITQVLLYFVHINKVFKHHLNNDSAILEGWGLLLVFILEKCCGV